MKVDRERQTSYDTTSNGTEREDTNERVHGTETDSQPWKTRWVPKEPSPQQEGLGVWDWLLHTEYME